MKKTQDQLDLIHGLFENCVDENPDQMAVFYEGESLTYEGLDRKANLLAHHLQKLGIKPNTIIAIAIKRSIDLMIGVLGILKAGCAYLPLDETHPIESLSYILADAKCNVIIIPPSLKDKFDNFKGQKIVIDHDLKFLDAYSDDRLSTNTTKDDLAYVIYTSGSTGKPKGVLIEHKSVTNYTKWFGDFSGCHKQDRCDFSSNFNFDFSITTTISALALNLQVIICSDEIKRNIKKYFEYLQINKIQMIKATPSYFRLMVEEIKNKSIPFPNLKKVILAGENLLAIDCKNWLTAYPDHQLFNEYGPTEATVGVTEYTITQKNKDIHRGSVPIGKPGINIECNIVNVADGKQAQKGEVGELYISGICLARGYLNQPELTAKSFIQIDDKKWYKTGDLCQYLPDGNIEFIGRIDDQVKIRGYKIEPREIELNLLSHPDIQDVVVISREMSDKEKRLIAYYIPKNKKATIHYQKLRQYLKEHLAEYMIPAHFIQLETFPLNENKKLNKKLLPDPVITFEEIKGQTISMLEKKLLNIWKKVFHVDKIGVTTDFIELGGNSLHAARIVSNVEKYLNKKINVKDLYTASNVRKLAEKVESSQEIKKEFETTSIKQKNLIILGDFQFTFWISNLFAPQIKHLNIISRRRLLGKIDVNILKSAFETLIKKQEVLRYRTSKIFPYQYLEKKFQFTLMEEDLRKLSTIEKEATLNASLTQLLNHPWKKNKPLLAAKLFYLTNDTSELQISASHMVFDDISEKILFSELSDIYLTNKNQHIWADLIQFRDYITYEQNHLNKQIDKDIKFWENYFSDTQLVKLPLEDIISSKSNKYFTYSTYIELPTEALSNLQNISKDARVSIMDMICASISLSLKEMAGHLNQDKICFNIVKSTRDNEAFDNTIGCFAKLDFIKVDLQENLDLFELAKSIQQSRIETQPYQGCSGMLKLACLEKKSRKHFIRNYFTYLSAYIYSTIFKNLKLQPKLLMMYKRIKFLIKPQEFLITINLLNNFLSTNFEKNLFGVEVIESPTYQYNVSNVDNVLNIFLFKNEINNQSYLVVSGNLTQSFRSKLGNKIKEMIFC